MRNMTVNHCFERRNLDLVNLAGMSVNPADLVTAGITLYCIMV